jgi:hypothetical protein
MPSGDGLRARQWLMALSMSVMWMPAMGGESIAPGAAACSTASAADKWRSQTEMGHLS